MTTNRHRSTSLVIAVASTVIAVLLVEQALRVFHVAPTRSQYASQFIEHDSLRGWRNAAGARGHYTTDEFHIALEYNARGFRGPLPPQHKSPGDFRVLMLGDSFVEGFTVGEDERVSSVLERRLQRAEEAAGGDVVALGISGYSTDQQLLWLERDGLGYAPDLVVLMFYYNDLWGNAHDRYAFGYKPRFVLAGDTLRLLNVPVPPPPRLDPDAGTMRRVAVWLTEHSRLAALASRASKSAPALRTFATSLGMTSGPVDPGAGRTDLPAEFLPFTAPFSPSADSTWRLTEALIERMRSASERAGARFVVFYIPFRSTVQRAGIATPEDFSLPDIPAGADSVAIRLAELCARRGIDCLDPTWEFVAAARERSKKDERLYFNYDWHWTAAGHALAADLLAAHIARMRAGFGGG